MSPLMVIRTLAGSPLSNLGNVRPYLLSVCQSEQKQVDEHARVIEQYRVETNQVRQRIHDLQSQALTLKQTKCSGECHFQEKVNLPHNFEKISQTFLKLLRTNSKYFP